MKSYNWQPGRACTEALVLNHSNMAESATSDRRIWFLENPWPKGHKITEFRWCATLKEGDTGQPKEVWLNLSLETEEYNAADPEIDEASAYDNIDDDVPVWICRQDWMCYRSCGVNRDGGRGFRLCTQEQYNPDFLDGLEVEVDMQRDLDDPEDQEIAAFTIFVLRWVTTPWGVTASGSRGWPTRTSSRSFGPGRLPLPTAARATSRKTSEQSLATSGSHGLRSRIKDGLASAAASWRFSLVCNYAISPRFAWNQGLISIVARCLMYTR